MQIGRTYKFYFGLVVLWGINLTISGQNFHYSNMHENMFKMNPSRIAYVEKLSFQLSYRNQWPGTTDFVTYDGSVIASSERLKSSLGGYVYRDAQGGDIITNTSIGIMYAYRTRIYRNWEASAGVSGSLNLYNRNFGNLTLENGDVTSVSSGNEMYGNFSGGITFSYAEEFSMGFSATNMGNPVIESITLPGIQYSLFAEGKYLLTKNYSRVSTYFEPLLWASWGVDQNELLYGGRLNFSGILGGLYARQDFNLNFDALILLLGTQLGNVRFYYTYDINLSSASARFSNLAAHEVTFLYGLEYKRKSKKRHGAIKCPDI